MQSNAYRTSNIKPSNNNDAINIKDGQRKQIRFRHTVYLRGAETTAGVALRLTSDMDLVLDRARWEGE